MDIDLNPPDPKGDALKRKMYSDSLDVIRVYNPTDKDYLLDWDGFKHKIPAKQQKSLQRYLANKYCREMKNLLINEMADKELEKLKQSLIDKGDTDAVYNANDRFQRQAKYRTDNVELINSIYKDIWLGVEEKYGYDEVEDKPRYDDTRHASPEDEVLSNMDFMYKGETVIDEDTSEIPTKYPINSKSTK